MDIKKVKDIAINMIDKLVNTTTTIIYVCDFTLSPLETGTRSVNVRENGEIIDIRVLGRNDDDNSYNQFNSFKVTNTSNDVPLQINFDNNQNSNDWLEFANFNRDEYNGFMNNVFSGFKYRRNDTIKIDCRCNIANDEAKSEIQILLICREKMRFNF